MSSQGYEGVQPENPLTLDDATRKELIDYLVAEDEEATKERAPLDERVIKWRRQREQEPEKAKKSFPWDGASNVATPLAAMATNANYAFLRAAFALRDPFWTVSSPMNPALGDDATAVTEMLRYMSRSPYHLNLAKNLEDILYIAASEGNCFVKIPWSIEHWQFKGTDTSGAVQQISRTLHDGPEMIPIPFEDFMVRARVQSLQKAPWIRHRVYLNWHELMQRKANWIYANVDLIEGGYVDTFGDVKEEDLRRAGFEPKESKLWDMREYHVFWDIDGDGIPEDFILTMNWDTKESVREIYNDLGIRPFVNVPYEVRPHSLYRMGVGARAERLQDEVDTHRNYRIDGMVLANLRMVVAKRNAGLSPKEKLYPGKILFMDNPREDITTLQFGEIYPSSMEAEYGAVNYLKQITGLSDYSIGFNDPNVKYPTTSGMMYLGQQGSTVRGSIIESVQNAMSEIGQVVLFQCIRNKDRLNLDYFDQVMKPAIDRVLAMKVEDIPTSFQFLVKTTDINRTEESKRQNLLMLTQLYAKYYADITQTLMMASSPQVPEQVKSIIYRHFTGASRMMEKTLKYFGEDDTEKYLPDFRKAEMLLSALSRQQGAGGGGIGGQGQGILNGGAAGAMGPVGGGAVPAGAAPGEPGMGGSTQTSTLAP